MRLFRNTLAFAISLHAITLLFLSAFRLVQFIALHHMIGHNDSGAWGAFMHGIWFDNVVCCYITILPLAVLTLSAALGASPLWLRRTATIWYSIFATVVFATSAANIPYYEYFSRPINSSIFEWFGYARTTAGMVFGEVSWIIYIIIFMVVSAVYCILIFACMTHFNHIIHNTSCNHKGNIRTVSALLLTSLGLIGLCIFGIRGRIGYNPIKVSEAYYCDNPFLNQLGIAPAFNLLTSVLDDMRKENRELHLMPYPEAISLSRSYLGIQGDVNDSTQLLRRHITAIADSTTLPPRRNVVVILMESMSANLVNKRLTPNIDSLSHCGLFFSQCYSAGIHTNHGITASLYSFPAMMKRNLMKGTVTARRDGLPTILKSQGYHTMFFMTHESQYDNMQAFFKTNGFDEVYSQEDYPSNEVVNSFGVPDHFLFSYGLDKINEVASHNKPFMATLLTVSNHPPYVIPDWFKAKSKDDEEKIMEYADWCIGHFLSEARKQKWYDNTIFVMLGDHGKRAGNSNSELPDSYNHIPMIIFGHGIEPTTIDRLATQVDLMPTLLSLMGISYDYNGFGQDIIHKPRQMVFYSADDQIVARDSSHLFVHYPNQQRTLCYRISASGQQVNDNNTSAPAYQQLRKYSFAMMQTAEYLYRRKASR